MYVGSLLRSIETPQQATEAAHVIYVARDSRALVVERGSSLKGLVGTMWKDVGFVLLWDRENLLYVLKPACIPPSEEGMLQWVLH